MVSAGSGWGVRSRAWAAVRTAWAVREAQLAQLSWSQVRVWADRSARAWSYSSAAMVARSAMLPALADDPGVPGFGLVGAGVAGGAGHAGFVVGVAGGGRADDLAGDDEP